MEKPAPVSRCRGQASSNLKPVAANPDRAAFTYETVELGQHPANFYADYNVKTIG
ncbi:hypothetical protein RKLH11_976 [Rhodobacteraceae bacterium KLH11]|nr:hypothetical protein RKLH11_976 [Rhodobacteraceae bacterium KLH11]